MIKLDATLNNKQFATFIAAIHAAYPEFRHQTGGIPISRVQIAKNGVEVIIKPLGKFVLPGGVETFARRILANVLADEALTQDSEFNYSDISRRAEQTKRRAAMQERQDLATIRERRRRQAGVRVGK